MVTKKSKKANLENKRTLFFEIGMMLAIALALMALETDNVNSGNNDYQFLPSGESIDEEVMMPIKWKEPDQPPVPQQIVQKFEIKDNDWELDDPDFDFNVDADADEGFEFFPIGDPEEEEPEEMDVVIFADKMPQYNGCGLECFHKFIQETVLYPQLAIENHIQGRVYVRFIVDKKGVLKNIEIMKGVHPLLDNAVIEALNKSERWQPGMQGPMPVNVSMSMPVTFTLREGI